MVLSLVVAIVNKSSDAEIERAIAAEAEAAAMNWASESSDDSAENWADTAVQTESTEGAAETVSAE